MNVAHSPNVIFRRFLRSPASPKTSAEPLRLLLLTISKYFSGYPSLFNWEKKKI